MLQSKDIGEWIRKHDPHICCLQETHLRTEDLHRLKVNSWKNFPSKWTGKKSSGSNTHIRQNRLQKRAIKRDPEGHLIILKGRFHQKDINIVNIYAPNIGAPKYIQKILEDLEERY